MLAGVLLDVVEAAGPIDRSLNGGAGEQRLAGKVPDFSLVVLLHAFDRYFEGGSVARGGGEEAGVVRLAATGGVKRASIERYLPDRDAVGPRGFANIHDLRGKALEEGVVVIKAVSHIDLKEAVLAERLFQALTVMRNPIFALQPGRNSSIQGNFSPAGAFRSIRIVGPLCPARTDFQVSLFSHSWP